MRLTFVCKDPDSRPGADCPGFYRTDQESWVVQGWRVTDSETLAQLDIPAHETVLEIPDRLVQLFLGLHGKETDGTDQR